MVTEKTITVSYDQARQIINNLLIGNDVVTKKVLRETVEGIVNSIKSDIVSGDHVYSGELLNTTGILEEGDDYFIVGSTSKHLIPFEYGHGPIKPVKAKALHFITKEGEEVFTMYVGPTEGTGIFDKNAIKGSRNFPVRFVEEIEKQS